MVQKFFVVFLLVALAGATTIGGVGPECAACGFIVNELEGFLVEPREEAEVEQFLKTEVCPKFSSKLQFVCDLLADSVPLLLKSFDKRFEVGNVCMEVGLCSKNLTSGVDMQPIPTYQLNMDAAPEDRWTELCGMPHAAAYLDGLIKVLSETLGEEGAAAAEKAGMGIWQLMPREYALEIQGCAAAANVPQGLTTLLNVAYELSDACTSIVAQTTDGQIYHARNLDFGMGGFLTATMRNISAVLELTQGGKVVAREAGFIGFIGMLSGQRLGKFTVTVNTRFYQGSAHKSLMEMLDEAIFAIENYPNAHLAAFLVRDAVWQADSFEEAVQMLSTKELIADVYYTVSGTAAGQGVVLTRNRTTAENVWTLGSSPSGPGSWYVLMTNYDHTKKAPWFDDRMDAGYADMAAMSQAGISLPNLLTVLSTRPTLNLLTSYSLLAYNANSTFTVYNRFCQYPCSL